MNPNRSMDPAWVFFFLFFLGLAATHGADRSLAGAGCKAKEREALLQFKKEVADYKGRMLSSWDEEQERDCCRWKGVSCHNTTGYILSLHLPGTVLPFEHQNVESLYYLDGNISMSLLELRFVEYLDLSQNYLNPDAFLVGVGSMKNLKHLNLSSNRGNFSTCKQIQHWSLGNLSKLEVLDLSDFGYYTCKWGRCEWLSGLPSLTYLSMRRARFWDSTNLFESINRMPSLLYLDLSFCRLVKFSPVSSGLTPQYMNFTMLKHLDLSYNKLVFKPPHWIGNLTSLEYLDLTYNSLLEDPGGFLLRNLSRLQTLDLYSTRISSNLEDFLVGLRHGGVVSLDLSYSNIAGHIPEWIGTCRTLKELFLDENNLSGPIPRSIGDLPSLVYLDLSSNRLQGSISPSIGMLRSLKVLSLHDNDLNGSIPESLWQLPLLSVLKFWRNSLHGVVTEQHLSNLPNLHGLYLDDNFLQLKVPLQWVPPFSLSSLSLSSCIPGQQFPRWIRTQKQLRSLSMRDSCISGALPQWIWNFSPFLSCVFLSGNMITGAIPGPVANTSLERIDLSSNRLQGSLPRFTNNTGLEVLNLSNNSLSGHILLDDVSNLEKLDLSMNNFSGTVHPSLCNARQLVGLYLSDNQLSGSLPNCMCASKPRSYSDNSIIDLRLNRNHFNGTFPQFLQNCSLMVILDLGENTLSGEIPDWIVGSMVDLRILRLASNRFNGSIPQNLWNFTQLRILDLSNNNLSGSIPSSFSHFSAMKTTPDSDNDEYSFKYQFRVGDGKKMILQIKGALLHYTTQLKHVRDMDLSGNQLSGQIPSELGNLTGLQGLNLSSNHLLGNIPPGLGNMFSLESLDLSENRLSGGIPRALVQLSFMATFNVSYNNLSGTIPRDGQFSTFLNTSYIDNPGLCGPPLSKPCTSSSPQNPDATPPNVGNHDTLWFLFGMVPGFVFGFWIFWGPLLLMTRWRYAYFRFLDDVCYKYLGHYLCIF